ncbi:MAG: hypothetical protein R6U37_02370 [Dehalococcoidia bacterium]
MSGNIRVSRTFSLLVAFVPVIALLLSACTGSDDSHASDAKPYDYTHTTKLQQAEFYENPRIETADRSSVISLDQLGYPELIITSGDEAENPSVQYRLPADATQGPDTWYIVHLHCLIEFDESTGGGFGSVKLSTNDFGGASVHFDTQTINDSPMISFGGMQCPSTRIEIHYYKYATLMGIKPGTNIMTFGFNAKKKAKINRVTYYGDTGIESTDVPPSEQAYREVIPERDRVRAEEIALSDPTVREIVDGVAYAIRITWEDIGLAVINEQFVEAEDADEREVEVRLMFEETQMVEDVEAAALSVYVDLDPEQVTGIFPLSSNGMPELTQSRKDIAMAIALSDPHVAAMLEGSDYTLRQASICRGGPVGRIGAYLIFDFHPYLEYDGDFPFFPGEDVRHLEGRIHDINVSINFQEEKVVQIYPTTIPQMRSNDAT